MTVSWMLEEIITKPSPHYVLTESTISGRDVVLIPGLLSTAEPDYAVPHPPEIYRMPLS